MSFLLSQSEVGAARRTAEAKIGSGATTPGRHSSRRTTNFLLLLGRACALHVVRASRIRSCVFPTVGRDGPRVSAQLQVGRQLEAPSISIQSSAHGRLLPPGRRGDGGRRQERYKAKQALSRTPSTRARRRAHYLLTSRAAKVDDLLKARHPSRHETLVLWPRNSAMTSSRAKLLLNPMDLLSAAADSGQHMHVPGALNSTCGGGCCSSKLH